MRQPSCSVLEPDSRSPFGNCTGLFLTGPMMPSGRRIGLDHVRPLLKLWKQTAEDDTHLVHVARMALREAHAKLEAE